MTTTGWQTVVAERNQRRADAYDRYRRARIIELVVAALCVLSAIVIAAVAVS